MKIKSKEIKKLGCFDIPMGLRPFINCQVIGAEVGAEQTEIKFEYSYTIIGKLLFLPLAFILHWIKYGICGLADFVPFTAVRTLTVKNEKIKIQDLLWLDDQVPNIYISPELDYSRF